MSVVRKIKKIAARAAGKIVPVTGKELAFLKSVLEKRFLNFGVEPTNLCNAACPFCAYRFSKTAKRVMPLELYKKAVEEYNALGGGGMALTPTIGEPLMDKTIIEKIKIARNYPNIGNIFFYTNLINLGQFDIKELLLSGINRISVSTAIGSGEMYARLFGTDKYDVMLQNLIRLLETNKELGEPVNVVLALRFDKNFDLCNSADYGKVAKLIDKKKITKLPNERGYDNWGGVIKEKDLPEDAKFRKSEKDRSEPCAELYRRINVLANGDVNFCVCRDFDYEMVIGNIRDNDLISLWHGDKLRRLRGDWAKGSVPAICRNCSNYEPLSNFLKKSRIAIWSLSRRIKRGH